MNNSRQTYRRGTHWLILGLLIVIAIFVWQFHDAADISESTNPMREGSRMPVSNPPLEPDRPDLIGEPRIDDPLNEDSDETLQ